MNYFLIGIVFAAFALGGPLIGALCGAAGIIFIFYLNFELGPKLTLIAIPVVICFFICITFENFVWMYFKHALIYVLICLVVTAAFCRYYYGEDYKHIVIGVTAGFTIFTMVALAVWMYNPKDFSVPNRTIGIEIQDIDKPECVVYTDSSEFEEIIEKIEEIEMLGAFEELADVDRRRDIYRVTFLNKDGKDIKTYYFTSKYCMIKEKGKGYVYYRRTDSRRFPYEYIADMYERAQTINE